MSARDELAQLVATTLDRIFGNREAEPAQQDYKLTDELLAAGYSKPRTITTVEELDALPKGSVVLDNEGYGEVYQKASRRPEGIKWYEPGYALHWDSLELNLPAIVLYAPKES